MKGIKLWMARRYPLTEKGLEGLLRASVTSFFQHIAYMLPMVLVFFFIQQVLEAVPLSLRFYLSRIFLVAVVMTGVIYLAYNALYKNTYRESAELRLEIGKQLSRLPLHFFNRHNLSDISTTLLDDIGAIEHALSHALPEFVGCVAFTLVLSILLIAQCPPLGLAILIPFLLTFTVIFVQRNRQTLHYQQHYQQMRKVTEDFQQTIELQQEIRSYGLEEKVLDQGIRDAQESERKQIGAELVAALFVCGGALLFNFSVCLTILLGSRLYQSGQVSLLYLIGYTLAAVKLIDLMNLISMTLSELLYLDARFQSLWRIRKTPLQEGEPRILNQHDIQVSHLSFQYEDHHPILQDVSFRAPAGQVTAIVGPSGCGKSTVLRLISRLYDSPEGEILIDNQEIKTISADSLYQNISMVFQTVTLFNTSVMENIRLGRPEASDEEVLNAAKLAYCDEFVSQLPQGYQTLIGENGSRLSGGERQRLSIARAILKDAPILLLDEISASLDVENEMKIQQSLTRLIPGKTVIIVSHRLKSIENADQIIVMEQGRIQAQGTHQALMDTPLYRNLVEKSRQTEAFTY